MEVILLSGGKSNRNINHSRTPRYQHEMARKKKKKKSNILNIQSRILSPIHNLIWPEAIQLIRSSKDHRCFSCGLQRREACVSHKDHRLATYRKGLCITILSSKDWAGAQGSCATASPPHRHTQRGDLDLQAGTRDLSAGTQAWTLLQLARGEQAGFLHTRHDISELIPPPPQQHHHHHHPPPLSPSLLLLPCRPPPPTACPFASWPQLDGGDGIWTQLRHRVSTFHRWLGEALHGGEETERKKRERKRERGSLDARRRSGADFTPR